MTDILIEGCRLVGGHPMDHKQKTDHKTGVPKTRNDGTPALETYIYVALPKNGTTDWRQTPIGQVMTDVAAKAFKPNEVGAPDFAWKVIDGDSATPMKGGKPAPNTREGYPGHWVFRMTTGIPVRCHHFGKYGPHEQIQDRNEIKCGDYCSVFVNIEGNNIKGYQESNGLYMNPTLFRLDRAGEQIITTGGPDAEEVFGGAPATTAPPPQPPTAGAPPPPPHNPLPKRYVYNGTEYTREQLQGFGWNDQQIDSIEVK